MATLSATGQDVFHNYFFPFVEGFIYVNANDIEDLKAKCDDTVCAVMFEYVQGEGGVMTLDKEFVDSIFDICESKDILTISDEVQTGVGRTGKFLAGEHYGKKADIMILDLNHPSMQPLNNPVASLCYSASGYEVESLIIDGEFVMENYEIKALDAERIYFECNKAMKRIDS